MKQFNVRVPEEIYDTVKKKAKDKGVSLSEFIRELVTKACTENAAEQNPHEATLWLREELQQRNEEIIALRTSQREERQRHDTIVLQMVKQLENTQIQLEDLRKPKRRFWQRDKD